MHGGIYAAFFDELLMRTLNFMAHTSMSGISAKSRRVRGTFTRISTTNATTILTAAMKYSSGQWWANSVMSNRSVVIREIS